VSGLSASAKGTYDITLKDGPIEVDFGITATPSTENGYRSIFLFNVASQVQLLKINNTIETN
jgi:hypothetical protein